MERLIAFDFFSKDSASIGLLYSSGIHMSFQDGLIYCRTETEVQYRLVVEIARLLGRESVISIDLGNNLTTWHYFTGHNVKFIGKWRYSDGTREFLSAM